MIVGRSQDPLNPVIAAIPIHEAAQARMTVDVDFNKLPDCPQPKALPPVYRVAKRLMDIVVAGLTLTVLLPVFLVVGAAIAFTSKGPIFYKARRIGLSGKSLMFIKFRTMYVDADERRASIAHLNNHDGRIFKVKNDPRITKVGAFLRKFSLDELPQLIHVITGDMSLVGPRPQLPCEALNYKGEEWLRLSVKPGLTCFWQIQGRSDLGYDEWVALDLKYMREMGFWLDLKILFATPLAVLRGKGAY